MAPQVITMIVKEVKLMALSRGIRLHQYLDDWLSGPNTVLRVDNKSGEVQTKAKMFSFMAYEYHLDSALIKPTQERWVKLQDLILRLKSKHVLTARYLMSLIGLLASIEKMLP